MVDVVTSLVFETSHPLSKVGVGASTGFKEVFIEGVFVSEFVTGGISKDLTQVGNNLIPSYKEIIQKDPIPLYSSTYGGFLDLVCISPPPLQKVAIKKK